jgi:lipoprotein LprG
LLAAVLLLAGCTKSSGGQSTAQLPEATQLLVASATAMRDVKTAHFTLDVQGKIADITVHHAEGSLTREGNAKGTATVEQFGATVEAEFVIVDKKVYVKGPTGGFQQVPASLAASVYDPSAILDPSRGVAKLLAGIKDPRTEAKESVGGQDAYRVAFTPAPGALDALVPGIGDHATGKLWLAVESKRVLKGEFTVPASGSDKGGTITITFSSYDAPVTISAP